MKIFHFSDNHGSIDWMNSVDLSDMDMIISSGDFFPNCSRGNRIKEPSFQNAWFDKNANHIKDFLKGKPILVVNGNHDFIDLGDKLLEHGYYDTYKITPEGETINGITFAGFGEIPYIAGEWNGEIDWHELKELVEETFECRPEVLITHAPCAGILDAGFGIEPLLTHLSYHTHVVKHHFFGHIHIHGGKVQEAMDIVFHNNACGYGIAEIGE